MKFKNRKIEMPYEPIERFIRSLHLRQKYDDDHNKYWKKVMKINKKKSKRTGQYSESKYYETITEEAWAFIKDKYPFDNRPSFSKWIDGYFVYMEYQLYNYKIAFTYDSYSDCISAYRTSMQEKLKNLNKDDLPTLRYTFHKEFAQDIGIYFKTLMD